MSNLLKETENDILRSGHKVEEIIFIGSETSGHTCTWEEFVKLADKEYDDGFGCAKVATDLIIVFSDGSKMWRDEYDGSENWSYSTPFVMPDNPLPVKRLIGNYWPKLSDLQDDNDRHHKGE